MEVAELRGQSVVVETFELEERRDVVVEDVDVLIRFNVALVKLLKIESYYIDLMLIFELRETDCKSLTRKRLIELRITIHE